MAFQWIFILLPEPSLQLVPFHFAESVSYAANFTGMKQISWKLQFSFSSYCTGHDVNYKRHSDHQTGLNTEECLISTSLCFLPAKNNMVFQRSHLRAQTQLLCCL